VIVRTVEGSVRREAMVRQEGGEVALRRHRQETMTVTLHTLACNLQVWLYQAGWQGMGMLISESARICL
jgi:hypothetical protein